MGIKAWFYICLLTFLSLMFVAIVLPLSNGFLKGKTNYSGETQDESAGNSETEEMEQYYQIFKLNLGATEKQVKQAYENLVNVWCPEELSKYPHLQQIAYERKRQIELAYERLVGEWVNKTEAATPQIKTRKGRFDYRNTLKFSVD